ncbi:hypothetical protein GE061_016084 [Apolygus lucorum]|uniref:MD-2-related lipid-recognition domain-containing protein n=1 Tax=Apolygus lucorum TaxID=248454 RepID=A0A8S9XF76_APOLU|nr:hypothetical protein GE061_016084 [Apolygus lucorum]
MSSLLNHLAGAKRSTVAKKMVRIEAFQDCQDRPNTEQYLKNHNHIASLKIERIKMDQYISADYVVNRPVKSIHGNIQMLKCESKEPSTCEFIMNMKIPDICSQLVEKGMFWTPLMDAIHPQIKCPLTKQVHHITNGSFSSVSSTPFLTAIPGGTDSFWAIKFTYSDIDNVEAGCMYIVFKLYHVKVKQ